MVVDHPRRLHKRVADGRTDKVETTFLEILAHRIRFGCMRRNLAANPPAIHARLAADKLPDVTIERTELLLHFKKRPRVGNRRLNLQPVANNPLIAKQSPHLARFIARDLCRVEAVKRSTIVVALLEVCVPTESGLRTFKNQELE